MSSIFMREFEPMKTRAKTDAILPLSLTSADVFFRACISAGAISKRESIRSRRAATGLESVDHYPPCHHRSHPHVHPTPPCLAVPVVADRPAALVRPVRAGTQAIRHAAHRLPEIVHAVHVDQGARRVG